MDRDKTLPEETETVTNLSNWEPSWHKKVNIFSVFVICTWAIIFLITLDDLCFIIYNSCFGLYSILDTLWFLYLDSSTIPPGIKSSVLAHHFGCIGIVFSTFFTSVELQISVAAAYTVAEPFIWLRDGAIFLPEHAALLKNLSRWYFIFRTFALAVIFGIIIYFIIYLKEWTVYGIFLLCSACIIETLQIYWITNMFLKKFNADPARSFRNVLLYGIYVEHFALWSVLLIYIPEILNDSLQVGVIFFCYNIFHAITAVFQGYWTDYIGITKQVLMISCMKCIALPLFYLSGDNFTFLCLTACFSAVFGSICTPYKVYVSRINLDGDSSFDIALLVVAVIAAAGTLMASGAILYYLSSEIFFLLITLLKIFSVIMISLLFSKKEIKEFDSVTFSEIWNFDNSLTAVNRVMALIILQFLNHVIIDTFISQCAVFLQYHFDTSIFEIGIVFTITMLVSVFGPVGYAVINGAYPAHHTTWNFAVGISCMFISFFMILWENKFFFYVMLNFISLIVNAGTVNIISNIDQATSSEYKGAVMGVQDCADFLGSACGGLLGGVLGNASPSRGMLYGSIGSSFVLICIVISPELAKNNVSTGQVLLGGGTDSKNRIFHDFQDFLSTLWGSYRYHNRMIWGFLKGLERVLTIRKVCRNQVSFEKII